MKFDFRYVEIEYELWALGQILELVEPQIKFLEEHDHKRTFDVLHANGWGDDEAEVDLAFQDLNEKQQYVFPRFMRGPFIVSLWACFEAGIIELVNGKAKEIGAKIQLSELRGENLFDRAQRYCEAILDIPLDADMARLSRLKDLNLIRNSLAHGNGQQHAMRPDKWVALTVALKRQGTPPDEHRGFVILSDTYLKTAYEDVNNCLRDLILRVRGGPAFSS